MRIVQIMQIVHHLVQILRIVKIVVYHLVQIVRIVQIVHHLAEYLTTVGKYEGVPSNNKDLPVNCIPTKLAFASPCHTKQAVRINDVHFKVCQAMASQPQSTSQWHANQGLPVNGLTTKVCQKWQAN